MYFYDIIEIQKIILNIIPFRTKNTVKLQLRGIFL
nr:MAG TPA: hypothetical protein [Caudoviricetes sp.]